MIKFIRKIFKRFSLENKIISDQSKISQLENPEITPLQALENLKGTLKAHRREKKIDIILGCTDEDLKEFYGKSDRKFSKEIIKIYTRMQDNPE